MTAADRRRYLTLTVDAAAARGARAVLADIGGHLAPGRTDLPLVAADPDPALAPPRGLAAPELLGSVYEATRTPAQRRRDGAFYTPPALAAALARATLAGLGPAARVWDPAVGCGALLLAAARTLIDAGADPADVSAQIGGVDTDAVAVDAAVTAVGILTGVAPRAVRVGDGLEAPLGRWDAVIANPPFLGQLKHDTARSREAAAAVTARFGAVASGYVDSAGLFLLTALRAVRDGGTVGFVLPAPLLATRDGAAVRRQVGASSSVVRLWTPPAAEAAAFDAGVRVVLAVARRGGSPDAGAWGRGEWALLLGGDDGPPPPRLRTGGTVGDVATATADFRDQYYAAAAAVSDTGDGPPLITCGLIDPAHVWWGDRPARIGRRVWTRPRAVGLAGPAAAWAESRLVPKVMVATQTRVIEAAADREGRWLPVVPVISVLPGTCDLWSLLAVLLAPGVSAHARRTHAGAALSPDAIKLSARQVDALPLPADATAWEAGAAAARIATDAGERGDADAWRAALRTVGDAMADAYGATPDAVRSWWWERMGRLTAPTRTSTPAS